MIRFVKTTDATDICRIYAYYVKNSTATFAYEALDIEEWELRIQQHEEKYPFLVWAEDGKVLGYAYASSFREKEAYMWDVEISVYVRHDKTKLGIGNRLTKALLMILKAQHFQKVYSCITVPNDASIAMHLKLGFVRIGKFCKTGYKFNAWLDVEWLERTLNEETPPQMPLRIQELPELTLREYME